MKRRIWLGVIIVFFCLTTGLVPFSAGNEQPAVAALDSIGLTVSDIDLSVDFFSKVLSFEKSPTRRSTAPNTNTCTACSGCARGSCA